MGQKDIDYAELCAKRERGNRPKVRAAYTAYVHSPDPVMSKKTMHIFGAHQRLIETSDRACQYVEEFIDGLWDELWNERKVERLHFRTEIAERDAPPVRR